MKNKSIIFTKYPIHPVVIMILLWTTIYAVYLFAPIKLAQPLSVFGTLFILTHVCLFSLAAIYFSNLKGARCTPKKLHAQSGYSYNSIIMFFLITGIIGGSLAIISKLITVGAFDIYATTSLRNIRENDLYNAVTFNYSYTIVISALAFLFYPAGFIGTIVALLQYEKIARVNKILLNLFIVTIIFVSMISGSRSQMLVLLILISFSCYSRLKFKNTILPASAILKLMLLLLLLTFIFYSNFIWSVRSEVSKTTNSERVQLLKNNWGVEASDNLKATLQKHEKTDLTKNIIQPIFYLVHSLITTEKILNARNELPVMYGSYHIDLVASLLRTNQNTAEFLKRCNKILMDNHIYGFFAGAWGSLFIDFWYFSFLIAAMWGGVSGFAWKRFNNSPTVISGLCYTFSSYAIIIGFISPPFGFSNSFVLFIWLILFCGLQKILSRHYDDSVMSSPALATS